MRILKFIYWLSVTAFCALTFALVEFEPALMICSVAMLMAFLKGLSDYDDLLLQVTELKTVGVKLMTAQAEKIEQLEAVIATFKES